MPRGEARPATRHSPLVRITHWITAIAFLCLVISGVAILLAHPRLYWGETGARSGPSLIDLPLPFVLDVPIRGPGRYLHFLAAWIALFTGLIYVISGLFTRHFRRHLLPEKSDLSWKQIREVILRHLRFERPPKEEALTYKPPPATHVSVGNLRSISSDVLEPVSPCLQRSHPYSRRSSLFLAASNQHARFISSLPPF